MLSANNILETAKKSQLTYLESSLKKLENFNTEHGGEDIIIRAKDISKDEYIFSLSAALPTTGKFIYFFSVIDSSSIENDFHNFIAKRPSETKLAKFNKGNVGAKILYVGSSNSLK